MKRIAINVIILSLSAVLCVWLLNNDIIREIFYIILISFIVAYAIKPIVRYFNKKGYNKKFISIAAILLVFGVFISILAFFIPKMIKESSNLSGSIEEIEKSISYIYNNIMNNKLFGLVHTEIEGKVIEYTSKTLNDMINNALELGEHLLSLAVIPVISYYFLADGKRFWEKFLMIMPVRRRSVIKLIINDVDKILSKYVISQVILSILIGVLTFIILIVLKVDFPLALSFINAIANIIPYFGPIFGGIPAILLALLQSPQKALYTTILLIIIQQIEGDLISPKIVGDSISIHPMIVIILLIVGGKIGGFIGMVLVIPFAVIIKVIYEDINYYLF